MRHRRLGVLLLLLAIGSHRADGQALPGVPATQPPAPATAGRPEPAPDALGRSTPRGTVLGFLAAARRGDDTLARQYLNVRPGAANAGDLAQQLFAVLDARLPARLTQVSESPEGSRLNPLTPDLETIGEVTGPDGPIPIVLERVARPRTAAIWLFSAATLDAIGPIYDDVSAERARLVLPQFLIDRRVANVRLFEWLAILLALTAMYLMTVVLNRLLTHAVVPIWRRVFRKPKIASADVLPLPARLLLITIASRWLFSMLPVSLLVRQFFSNVSAPVLIASLAWLLILLNGGVERRLIRRVPAANLAATLSLLRVARRLVDIVLVFLAVVVTLRHYGVNPTPILAGLGVGGLAVALAAQKTLENVIAGASLIFDQALRVGDSLRLGTIEGTVDHIGLRSTRIRTLDRTIVSVPNGQIANMSIEIVSERDRFWFHPVVQLRYETTPAQLRAVVDGIRALLDGDAAVDRTSIRVRFLRLGAFSLDVEVSAYVFARDWAHFLELQEQLLFHVIDVVDKAGTAIAFPSQTMYVARPAVAESA